MPEMSAKERKALVKRIAALFALMGSDNKGERDNARAKLDELLRKHGKNWNDLPQLLQEAKQAEEAKQAAASSSRDPRDDAPAEAAADVSALDLIHYLLEQYLDLKPHEYVAVALWALHAHVYDRFMVTPRLALMSPVRGCGKTLVLDVLERLTPRAEKTDSITPAAIYHLIDRERCTLLLDEGDNLGLVFQPTLRAVLNSGHRKGGKTTRVMSGTARHFPTFAPMAIAAIGVLPLPIMHRSIVIHMVRATRPLRRFEENDLDDLNIGYTMSRLWARHAKLNPDPNLPEELRNRPADNWRPLIAIADSFGKTWGATARAAAVTFARSHHDEDASVLLLADIRKVFDAHGADRIASATLVAKLVEMDDSMWSEWRGLRDDQQPRRLSQGELARLLAPFGIKPRSIWPLRRVEKGESSRKGYYRVQFEHAWSSYCSEAGTPAHPGKVRHLHSA